MSTAQEIAEWARDGIADFVADNWADRKYSLDEIEKMLRSVEINTSKRFPAPGAPAEPTEAMVAAMVRRMFSEKNYAAAWEDVMRLVYMDAIAAAPGAPGQEAAAVQAVGAGIIGWATHHEEPMLFPTRKEAAEYCNDDEEPIPLVSALPPSGAGEKTS